MNKNKAYKPIKKPRRSRRRSNYKEPLKPKKQQNEKKDIGPIKEGFIYHLSRKFSPGGVSHDVVVVKHDEKNKTSKVRTITSLEKGSGSSANLYIDGCHRARDHIVVPIPNDELKARHWSGLHRKEFVVADANLTRKKYVNAEKIKKKYITLEPPLRENKKKTKK